ncbi:MAG: Uma2 family endonuclease [Nostocales cyanobacterium]|nr:MAG: Uma2 family endonuclease [Nostocales cyanobacterium]TAF18408.1 MAG: Uma2 family endonuclease [Nostocales cyanobacterium]
MTITREQQITLNDFLKLPETKPASEFINGKIIQKPMPQGEHSRLQIKMCTTINQVAETQKIAYAFPELRCTFGGDTIVPDVAVFRWERIPKTTTGKISNRFEIHPDWIIEILSPEQQQKKVLSKLLHCSRNDTELGWLINPDEESVLAVFPGQKIDLYDGDDQLPIIAGVELKLTASEVFGWLSFS